MSVADSRSRALNAFRPGVAIASPSKFAGRKDTIQELTDALLMYGSTPVVYGDAGLGKSSIAAQVERIAVGDVELLHDLDLAQHALPEHEHFATFYMQCTDAIASKDELLQRVINMSDGFCSVSDLPYNTSEAIEMRSRNAIKFHAFESEVITVYRQNNPLTKYQDLSVEEKLQAIIEHISRRFNKKTLIILDEFDRVQNSKGLASFIKSNSSESLKIMLVGIAQNLSELLDEHQSLQRSTIPVRVDPMDCDELKKIIDLAERDLLENEIPLPFSDSAKEKIVQFADGYPWFVHILGQAALLSAFDSGDHLVVDSHIDHAVTDLAKNRYVRQFEETYLHAVADSIQRETVLRCFAKWKAHDVPTSEAYRVARSLKVRNPYQCVQYLRGQNGGPTILAKGNSPKTYYFRNAMFKRYVLLRPSLFLNVDDRVDHAWRSRFA